MRFAGRASLVAVIVAIAGIAVAQNGPDRKPVQAELRFQADPAPSQLVDGYVPGLKVSINNHGDLFQPAAGDAWRLEQSSSLCRVGNANQDHKDLKRNMGQPVDKPGGPRVDGRAEAQAS